MKSNQLKLGVMTERRRPASLTPDLTEGDIFPFGWRKEQGVKMMDVDMTWYRWFLEQHWAQKWPGVQKYALKILAPERAARASVALPIRPKPADPKHDPVKAQAAFEAFQKLKGNL